MDFAKVVVKRRMVRTFKKDPVPKDTIRRILDLAQHYPSAGFSQEVAFVVVTNRETRKRLRKWRDLHSEAPVMIVPCVSEEVVHDRYREADKIRAGGREIDWPVPFWYFDVGCACMILLLAAISEGLSAGFAGSVGIFKPGALREELGVPRQYEPVGIISLGYPDYEHDVLSPSLRRGRRSIDQFVHFERW